MSTRTLTDLIDRMRALEADHEPEGWPAVQMRDISALCDHIEAVAEDPDVCPNCGWTAEDDF